MQKNLKERPEWRSKRILIPALVAVIALSGAGLWWLRREADCREMLSQPSFVDSIVVRDKAGRCYTCRDEGWLYDIAFKTCPEPVSVT
jgi:hypothetical protein